MTREALGPNLGFRTEPLSRPFGDGGGTADLTPKQIGRILKDAGMPESITQHDVAMAHLYFAAETTGKPTGQSMSVLYRDQVKPA